MTADVGVIAVLYSWSHTYPPLKTFYLLMRAIFHYPPAMIHRRAPVPATCLLPSVSLLSHPCLRGWKSGPVLCPVVRVLPHPPFLMRQWIGKTR